MKPAGSLRPALIVGAVMLASSVLVYFPFRSDFSVIYRYWDGPLYAYLAKTLYQIPADHPFVAYGLPQIYFASHLPLYPLLIRLCSIFTLGNYFAAMLLVTLLSSVTSAILFLRLLETQQWVKSPLWTAILFCFFPARWLIYHSVGATEPLFLCFVLAAFLAYHHDRFGFLLLVIACASLTRITGSLLIPVFGLLYLLQKQWVKACTVPLAGLGVLALFCFYALIFQDFFAYFRWNAGQNQIFVLAPLRIFRLYAANRNFHSTELYGWMYVLYGIGTLALWKRRELFIFCAIFFLFSTCVYHVDLSRYILVLAPFAILVSFDSILGMTVVRWILPLILYLDYLYAWGYIPFNTASAETYNALVQLFSSRYLIR